MAIFLLPIIGGLTLLPVDRANAHDFWIEPTDFLPPPGGEVEILLRVGEDLAGDRLPYINDWFTDYRIVAPSGARPVTGMMGDDPAGHFTVEEAGIHVIGYRSSRDFVRIEPAKFRSYLEAEGLEDIVALRAARGEAELPAREYYSRCAKSLIEAGTGGAADVFAVNLGYTLELIPETNPYALSPGAILPLRLLYLGEPIAGKLVQAFSSAYPESKVAARTDDQGRVSLPLDRAGLWLVKAVHLIETPATVEGAEWESYWASLTFRLPDDE